MNKNEIISPFAIPGLRRVDMPASLKRTAAANIISATIEYFNLKKGELDTRSRKRVYLYPRQCAIYLLTQYTTLGLYEIVDEFNDAVAHHSSIIHSREVIKNRLMINDGDVKEDIDAIYLLATNSEIVTPHEKTAAQ